MQRKRKSAINPKTISGRVKARPILSHCPKEWRPFRRSSKPALVSGNGTASCSSVVRLQAAALLAVLGPGVVHRAEGAA